MEIIKRIHTIEEFQEFKKKCEESKFSPDIIISLVELPKEECSVFYKYGTDFYFVSSEKAERNLLKELTDIYHCAQLI